MKIVNIIGGLGNQMFQYAFALSLKKRNPEEEVLIDTSHFNYIFIKKFRSANLHNGYEINKVFHNAPLKVAKATQLMKLTWYMPNYFLSRLIRRVLPPRKTEIIQEVNQFFAYDKKVYDITGDCYFEGIWEAISYHLPNRIFIQKIFSHGEPNSINATYIKDIESTNSVGIHIRRGDYLMHPAFRGICDLDYYKKAIEEINKDGLIHNYYIFSNDISWCETNIKPLVKGHKYEPITCNVGDNSCWDMFLMSYCKDLVIANSSFSWWGAFLNNRGGRVVAPAKWVNRDAEFDIWAPEWIKI